MALRLLLVGLVVGMGFDLPGGAEMASWARSEIEWVQARVDGWLATGTVDEAGPATDAEFSAIVDDMAVAFAADLDRAEPLAPLPVESTASRPAVASAPLDLPDEDEPGIAYALARDPEGLAPEATVMDAASPVRRLASAVRLTREAAAAWMSLTRGADAAVVVR